ncbi:MAG: ATP phosphoribosyltransferase regulatory subunit [Planctomycetota bacterium]|jgi:histidyl-tRNA synthetase
MSFRALPGFRDFYPEEMALRRHVEQAWHRAARTAGFEEVDGPPLESLDLLKAKSGDEIVNQLYAFTDKGNREVALRAEFTPTLARMVAERAASLRKPMKWYSVPQLFRYERQQRGRLREHFQWNVDIIGSSEVAADAELLSVAIEALRRLGLTSKQVYARVSDRRIAESKLRELGVEDTVAALTLIDRGLIDDDEACEGLPQAGAIRAWLAEPARPEDGFGDFLAACEAYGIAEFVELDKRIVRGLAYYTGVVFEIFDRDRSLRAIAGGGRYDQLTERVGGPALPATGFGMGDVVLSELLKDLGLVPERQPRLDALVVPIGEEMLGAARQVVRRLRDSGLSAEAPYAPVKVGKALKAADLAGARRAYLVGADEWSQGAVKVKDLRSSQEEIVDLENLA